MTDIDHDALVAAVRRFLEAEDAILATRHPPEPPDIVAWTARVAISRAAEAEGAESIVALAELVGYESSPAPERLSSLRQRALARLGPPPASKPHEQGAAALRGDEP